MNKLIDNPIYNLSLSFRVFSLTNSKVEPFSSCSISVPSLSRRRQHGVLFHLLDPSCPISSSDYVIYVVGFRIVVSSSSDSSFTDVTVTVRF